MKNRYHILYIIAYTLLLAAIASSCQRRPLEDEIGDLAVIPIHIDWSQSTLDVEEAHRVSVWFFPHDGRHSFELRYENNLKDMEAELPVGIYSIIVFNETVDSDWGSLRFEGSDKYQTFRVSAIEDTFRGLNTKTDEMDVRKTPDGIASWSTDRFEVTQEMIRASALDNRSEPSVLIRPIEVQLKPLTKKINITAYVQNLTSARRCSGTLTGARGAVMLATSEAVGEDVAHIFILNNRIYNERDPDNGYIHANFLIFKSPKNDYPKILQVDFELTDGTQSSPAPFDITKNINQEQMEIDINIGVEEEEEDHPIILPKVTVSGDVDVDDWEDEFIPMT